MIDMTNNDITTTTSGSRAAHNLTAHAVLEIAPHLAVCVTLGATVATVITFHYPDRSVELLLADCEDITPTVKRVYVAAYDAFRPLYHGTK